MKPSEIFDAHRIELERYLFSWGLSDKFKDMVRAREIGNEMTLARAAHYAWDALPDRPAIRRYPFGQLCNMAEQIFGIDE